MQPTYNIQFSTAAEIETDYIGAVQEFEGINK
jgi:hypothetical protein